jgi:hypothetical protein
MLFASASAYTDFVAAVALEARAASDAGPRKDARDTAYDLIWRRATRAVTSMREAGAVITFFQGDEADLVISRCGLGEVVATAVAMIECDARDLFTSLNPDLA